MIVAHRAERLVQSVELAAATLDHLEHGSSQVAAVTARTLFEIAATSCHVHSTRESTWQNVHGHPAQIRRVPNDAQERVWKSIWKARLGTKLEGGQGIAGGWPKAIHINDRLSALKS